MKSDRSSCGGPARRMKTAKIAMAIEPEIKNEIMEIVYLEGKKA